jgi:sRNA-binding regulator protein Hfq
VGSYEEEKTDKGKRRVHMEMERKEKVYLSIFFTGRMLHIVLALAQLIMINACNIWSLDVRSEGKQQLSYPNAIATVQ